MSRLDLVVGPNGAGKSTFIRFTVQPSWPHAAFVNADVIAADRWPDDPSSHGHDAARIAARTRDRLVELGQPLIAETVCSHPSKLALIERARSAGYHVALHVVMVPEELSVARVAARVVAGGHDVPEDKIRERHRRLWPIVADGVALADSASVWDNSRADGPELVASFTDGWLVGRATWPTWAPDALVECWPPTP